MATLTNKSRGPRTVQHRAGKDRVQTITLQPGETRDDIEIVDENDPVFKHFVDSNELVVGGGERKKRGEAKDPGMTGGGAGATNSDKTQQKLSEQNPRQNAEREAATNAGKVEGVVDADAAKRAKEADAKK